MNDKVCITHPEIGGYDGGEDRDHGVLGMIDKVCLTHPETGG